MRTRGLGLLQMSNNEGKVAYVDCRQTEPIWTITAHEKEVTGLILSDTVPGLLITSGTDGKLKTWDTHNIPATQISENTLRVGQSLCAAVSPDHPWSVAAGGDNKDHYIQLVHLDNDPAVLERFGARVPASVQPAGADHMET